MLNPGVPRPPTTRTGPRSWRAERFTTRERSFLGFGRVRRFAFVRRNGIATRKPTAEVDIRASPGTKWPKSLDRRSAADGTRLGLMRLHWIAHAANIGRAGLKGKGPLDASVAKLEIRPAGPTGCAAARSGLRVWRQPFRHNLCGGASWFAYRLSQRALRGRVLR
jgi:hypothetical protein